LGDDAGKTEGLPVAADASDTDGLGVIPIVEGGEEGGAVKDNDRDKETLPPLSLSSMS
jgi:hypothetical protein